MVTCFLSVGKIKQFFKNQIYLHSYRIFQNETSNDMFLEPSALVINEGSEYTHSTDSIFAFNYINLDEILNRNLARPIHTQTRIINKCLLNYFLFELDLEEHLAALRMYMLCENASFSQTLIDELCQTILFSTEQKSSFLFESQLNPIYVTEAFDKAVANIKNCKYIENFSIRLASEKAQMGSRSLGKQMNNQQSKILFFLNCFELRYKLAWPLNIIVTERCFARYNRIFQFLLQIKLVLGAITNIWYALKQFGKWFIFI